MTWLRCTLALPLTLVAFLATGCGSLFGRSEYGPRYPVYSGVALEASELWHQWTPPTITEDTVVYTIILLVDFPLTLVVDTALFPFEFTAWALSPKPAPEQPSPDPGKERWKALRQLDGLFFVDERLGPQEFVVRCDPPHIQIRPTKTPGRQLVQWVVVPIETDGDAADFYRRVTGRKHPTLKGSLGWDYVVFLEGKER